MSSSVYQKGTVNIPSSYHNIRKTIKRIGLRNNEDILYLNHWCITTTARVSLSLRIRCNLANSSIFIRSVTLSASIICLVTYTRLHTNHYFISFKQWIHYHFDSDNKPQLLEESWYSQRYQHWYMYRVSFLILSLHPRRGTSKRVIHIHYNEWFFAQWIQTLLKLSWCWYHSWKQPHWFHRVFYTCPIM